MIPFSCVSVNHVRAQFFLWPLNRLQREGSYMLHKRGEAETLMEAVGATVTHPCCFLSGKRWKHFLCVIYPAGANEVQNERSQTTQYTEQNQRALCSHCCAGLFTVTDNSAPARQVPQISDSDTCKRNCVSLCNAFLVFFFLFRSLSFKETS